MRTADYRTPRFPNDVARWFEGCDAAIDRLPKTVRRCPREGACERTLGPHEHLFFEGDRRTHLYFVLSGTLSRYKMLADGRRQIVRFACPGDAVGLDGSATQLDGAEALGDVRILCHPIDAVERLLREEPEFARALLGIASRELAEARERMLSLGRQSATERLASFLAHGARSFGGVRDGAADRVSIPVKRAELADYLGLTIETVSRSFMRLKESGVMRPRGHHEVDILDRERLESIAGGGERRPTY